MEEKIKEVLAVYINVPADRIGPSTAIDRSAVNSSIMLHRMYARLAGLGYVVENYQELSRFSDLMERLHPAGSPGAVELSNQPEMATAAHKEAGIAPEQSIGIDLEQVSALPKSTDFREDPFYTMNFSPAEMAYCILQPDPYSSFAGLFAAKEAMVKADNGFKKRPFSELVIDHEPGGKPIHPDFSLSISHAGEWAIAVAVRQVPPARTTPAVPAQAREVSPAKMNRTALLLFIAAALLCLGSIIISLKH